MSTSVLPAAAVSANTATLTEALAAASISSSPSPPSEPKELSSVEEGEYEDGEIREDDEDDEGEDVDDGRVKTVFDDANRFNVKVRFRTVSHVYWRGSGAKSARFMVAPAVFTMDAILRLSTVKTAPQNSVVNTCNPANRSWYVEDSFLTQPFYSGH